MSPLTSALGARPRSARLAATVAAAAIAAVGAAASATTTTTATADEDLAILASHVLMPDGTLKKDMGVHIGADGRIKQVLRASDLADHPRAIRLPDGAVLSPGLIDLAGSAGVVGSNRDGTRVVDPDVDILEGFDPHAPGLAAALEAGITAVMVAPAFDGLVDGVAATVRTRPNAAGEPDVLLAECALVMGLGDGTLDTAEGPTSTSGAMQMLRGMMRTAGRDADSRLARMTRGELRGLVRAQRPEDASGMLRLFDRMDRVPVMAVGSMAVEVAEELGEYGTPCITGPYTMNSSERTLAGAAALEAAGVPVAFASGLPSGSPDALRLTAALAARRGMSAAAARRGMTSTSAMIAGVPDRVGSIMVGRAADLVVFSGDPLRLDSRVLAVMIDGRLVHGDPTGAAPAHAHADHGATR